MSESIPPTSNDRTLPEGFRWERCACGLVQITTERVSVYGGRTGWGCPKCNLERAEKAEKEIERLTRELDANSDAIDTLQSDRYRLRTALERMIAWFRSRSGSPEGMLRVSQGEDALRSAKSDSAPETSGESAWLIEMTGGTEPAYWHAVADMRVIGGFDPDPNKAMRFCREKDARDMALMLGAKGLIAITEIRRVKITEHEWTPLKANREPGICIIPGCGRAGAVELEGGEWVCDPCVRKAALEGSMPCNWAAGCRDGKRCAAAGSCQNVLQCES